MKSMNRIVLTLAVCLAASSATPSWAQQSSGAPEQAAAAALELLNRGQIDEAVIAYDKVVKDFPTSLVVSEAQYRLSYVLFLQGSHDRSIEVLGKVMGPPAPNEIQELAASLLPQILSAKATRLEENDPKRVPLFEEAIKQFSNFLTKYPKNEEVESANYGRSLAQFQIKKFDDAVAGLRQNIATFARSESIFESEYLLALTLATQGKDQEAEKWFNDIIEKRVDLALANEAQFQIGEVYLNRAVATEGTGKEALYAKAMKTYEAVKTKEMVLKDHQARMEDFVKRIREAGLKRDIAGVKSIQRLQKLETTKIAATKGKSDMSIMARIKIGMCHFQMQKYADACSTLLAVQPLAETEDQKKQVQYYISLSYAYQEKADQAVAAYEEFQSKYKGDSLADNLPLVIGSMFLTGKADPSKPSAHLEKAISYFNETQKLYPKGRFTSQALLLKATALLQLKQLAEAQKAYKEFLATNPKREQAASAELGMAGISKDSGKTDEALAAYKSIRDKYAGLAEAEQAAFWVGQLAMTKGDAKTALAESNAFVTKYTESPMRSAALFTLAQAQQATGGKPKALELFQEIIQKYPDSEAAPYACFQIAGIHAADQKVDEMVAIMRTFIEKYPKNDKIFFAYDTIGQSQINAGKSADAITTYMELVEKHPEDPKASEALLKVSALWLNFARAQGIYTALNEEQRLEWNKGIASSMEAGTKLLENYSESPSVALTLQTMLEGQKLLVAAKIRTVAEVEEYFTGLASRFGNKPALKAKVLFKLAAYTFERDKASALKQMNDAFDGKLIYAPSDMDLYGSALVENGKFAEAQRVFEKLAADYPVPQGTDPSKATMQVQEAQAIAMYGIGSALEKQDKVAEAAAKFDLLKKLFPWSPKILEANFGIAKSLAQQKKHDDAAALLVQIIRAQTATADLRANSMLLGGDIQSEKGNLEAAIDYYIKIATFYEGVPAAAADGLWKGGNLLEKQAAGLNETSKPTKAAQLGKAAKAYKDLVDKYPNAPHVSEAKERLQKLQVK